MKNKVGVGTNWENLLSKVTAEVKGTSDFLKFRNTLDLLELGVVGNLEGTIDLLQHWQGDIGESRVVVENEGRPDVGEVRSKERLHVVGVESKATGDALKRRQGNAADITEGHVLGFLQVGEGDLQLLVVAGEINISRDLLHLVDINLLQVNVVGDVEVFDTVQFNTFQGVEEGVGDGNALGLGDTLGEREFVQASKRIEFDGADFLEGVELQAIEVGQTLEGELLADLLELGSAKVGDVGGTVAGQATLDLTDTVEGEFARNRIGDHDIAADLGAAGEVRTITGAFDGDLVLAACVSDQ